MNQASKNTKRFVLKSSMARRRRLRRKKMKSKMAVHTGNPGHECELEWTVENVLKLVKVTFNSRLSFERSCNSRFHLIVKIDYDAEGNYSDLCVGFQRIDSLKENIRLCFDISLQNTSGDIYQRNEGNFIYTSGGNTQWCMDLKVTDIQSDFEAISEDSLRERSDINLNLVAKELLVWDEDKLHGLYVLPEDTLLVKGSVNIYGCCVTSRLVPDQVELDSEIKKTDLMKDFEFALQTDLFADLQLNVNGEILSAHKFVLSARSPVLRRLLQRREDRGDDSPVNVKMEKPVLEAFLKYLYIGIVGDVRWATVVELYEAGVWFEVLSLKQHCGRVLGAKISEKRVCQVLMLADKYGDDALKEAAMNYIRDNFFKVKDTKEWVALIRKHPEIISNVLEEITSTLH